MNDAVAVVVTYNRIKLLKENISALLNQIMQCDIIIVDNASTDGTYDYINSLKDERILYENTGENIGGAGGFSYGMRLAEEKGYKYAWIMDDDSVPERGALESLVEKANLLGNQFSYFSSLVYWTDGTILQMNFPIYSHKSRLDIRPDLISKYKIMPIESASFVGCFVNLEVSRKAGLPIAEFFIYGDDVEYTERLRRTLPAYLDYDSVILHKAPSNKGADISTASADRIERFFYQSRNGMFIARKKGLVAILKRLGVVVKRTCKIFVNSRDKKLLRLFVLYKGTLNGFYFNPEVKYSSDVRDTVSLIGQ